jgi:hypothetical protein
MYVPKYIIILTSFVTSSACFDVIGKEEETSISRIQSWKLYVPNNTDFCLV